MRSCVVLLFASLLTLCEAQGTIVTPVFVLKGRDLLLKLHADPPEGFFFVDWKINKKDLLVRFIPGGKPHVDPRFTGRVQFGENKFSVILKNVQEVDSGVYSAVAATDTGDKLLTEYKVTVQGPVSPVELIVDRVDNSSESCDLHVTCRTQNSNISSTFRCVDWFCSQEGGERSKVTTSGASLQVYLLNNVIICNHSNQVHRTQDLIHAEQLCYPNTGTIVTPVFVLKGRDLLLKLHADPPENVSFVDWKINETVNLVRFKPSGEATVFRNSTGGFEFGGNKFSVILKNVQEVDSGVYSAEARTLQGNKLLTEYEVTVQGPVSPVELIVGRVDNSSSGSCDLHVTCRTHNSNISSTFRCVDQVCSQEGGERSKVTTSGASLQVYLLNNVIICNHNNQVHWTQDLIHAEQLCYPNTGTSVTPVFVQKGHDLLLKLQADPPEKFFFVDWKINKNDLLVRFIHGGEPHVDPRFTGRVQLDENKFSVILKNVQEVDSGVYSAVAATPTGDKLLTEYKVTVQDPPSHPGWMITTWILTVILVVVLVIVVGLIVCLYKNPKRLIGFMRKHGCINYEAAKRLEEALKEISASPENMSLADASGSS